VSHLKHDTSIYIIKMDVKNIITLIKIIIGHGSVACGHIYVRVRW
jgi:hypothetical protein